MRQATPSVRRRLRVSLGMLSLGTLLALPGCDNAEISAPAPPVTIPLTEGEWRLDRANGADLPAEIGRRFVGVTDEQTLVDSARLIVRGDDTWEQRIAVRVLHNGTLDREEVIFDTGTWTSAGNVSTFTSQVRPRTFTVTANSASQATSNEAMVFFVGATNVTGVYRTAPPPP